MLPTRHNSTAVAGSIFNTLRKLLAAKKVAIEEQFHLPIWNFMVTDLSTGEATFDAEGYKAAAISKTLSGADVADMVDQLNDPDAFVVNGKDRDKDMKRRKQLKAQYLQTFEAAGVEVSEDETGKLIVVGGAVEAEKVVTTGTTDLSTFLQTQIAAKKDSSVVEAPVDSSAAADSLVTGVGKNLTEEQKAALLRRHGVMGQ